MTAELNSTSIYLQKSKRVLLPPAHGKADRDLVATVAKNIQSLGFGLRPPLINRLMSLSNDDVIAWYDHIVPVLKEAVGAHRVFSPMYPNFPRQVMEASDAELYLNAILNYLGFALSDRFGDASIVILPDYEKQPRPALDELTSLRWIDLGDEDDFRSIFTRLAGSNSSLSEYDQNVLRWFVSEIDIEPLLPPSVRQRETLAILVALAPHSKPLGDQVKTATDVLRVAVAMSGGDVSLAEPCLFRNFAKRERRFLLELLESTGDTRVEDMLRWKERWLRLGERLHPGDFKRRFPKAMAAFDAVRNDTAPPNFYSRVESALVARDPGLVLDLLATRPGEFARRLDHLLRTFSMTDEIIDRFFKVATRVATPVLLQSWSHFQHRDAVGFRAFFPKGQAAKVQLLEEQHPALVDGVAQRVAHGLRQVLVDRFRQLSGLGSVWIDPRLKDQFVPYSQRSASRSLRSVVRGSRFALGEGDVVRFFLWWKNIERSNGGQARVDLDLSVSFFGDEWQSAGQIAFYNLREMGCYHSGDITSAPTGACEFIDISLSSAQQRGVRYLVMSAISFTGQHFIQLPECFAGWMLREEPNSGEVFEPRTVQEKVDLTSDASIAIPVIIDIRERWIYWADVELTSRRLFNHAQGSSSGISRIGRALTDLTKPTLFDLFLMHAEARGLSASSRDEAETVFGLYEGTVTAFQSDTILSEFLQ